LWESVRWHWAQRGRMMPLAGRTGKWRLRGQLKSCPLTTAQVWLALKGRGLGRMRPLALKRSGEG